MSDDEYSDNRLRNCFLHNEENSNNNVELKRKRKLQCSQENAIIPLSKYKFGDRLRVANEDNVGNPSEIKISPKVAFPTVKYGLRGESEESSDNEDEDYDTTMTLDLDNDEEKTSGESFPEDLPSTSSNTTRNSVVADNIDPLHDENNSKEGGKRAREDPEDALKNAKQYKGEDGHFGGLERGNAYSFSEILEAEVGHIDGEVENMMLYSNGFLDSSGTWSLQQDNLVRPKKPTIDQEFEQYFSMLML